MSGIAKSHKRGKKTRSFLAYTVWDNRTDRLLILDGEARECARLMKMPLHSFYCAVNRARSGKIKRWTIEAIYRDNGEDVAV